MEIIKAWAPPLGLGWGKWIDVYTHAGNRGAKVSFLSESDAESTFNIQILEGGKSIPKSYVGPIGNIRVRSEDCFCKTKVRFKSHFAGQIIRIEVS
ncbi:MAG: hypothetical protein GY932_12210 [Arcobacter sp.]|nr:hypothetical protein [Arcobacter sp.]